ncbi:MAG: helix-turn-helix transcriptional regulator, partial [Butyricicoccaceae bacterium]
IQDYIDQHYLEDISIAMISADMHMGESYLSHTFKKATGYSILQYIIRRRIGEAQSWLLMSDLSITDIATKVGYNSVSNFHNTFRKTVGMTPQQYRSYWKQH